MLGWLRGRHRCYRGTAEAFPPMLAGQIPELSSAASACDGMMELSFQDLSLASLFRKFRNDLFNWDVTHEGYHRGRKSCLVPSVPAWLANRGNLHNGICFNILSMLQFLWRSSFAIRWVRCACLEVMLNPSTWAPHAPVIVMVIGCAQAILSTIVGHCNVPCTLISPPHWVVIVMVMYTYVNL